MIAIMRFAIVFPFLAACPAPPVPPSIPPTEPAQLAGNDPPASGETTLDVVGEAPAEPPRDEPTLDASQSALLALHNRVRAAHCAPALAWSDALADEAAAWAQDLARRSCAFEHSTSRHGENLAMGTARALDAEAVMAMWAGEVEAYDFQRPRFGMDTGHFTQVVWKDTTHAGCATATCPGKGMAIWVCNYDPPGNVDGGFAANVAPARCR